jgi:RNA polymerase sigma factor (sigma-70 family)
MLPEEKELVQRFRMPGTRKVAFEQLVHRYSRPLFVHLSKFIYNREDVEDLLQTVWVKVWRGLDNFRGESKLSTWLFTIATREAYNVFRTRRPLYISDPEASLATDSGSSPEASQILGKLQEAMDSLPPKQQQVFVMRYFEDLSYEEMAAITGTSVGGLKASYHHAVRKIEQHINPH